jgi:hypothetical protein
MKKYLLSIEKPNELEKKFVFADSDIDEVRRYIDMKYHGAKKIYPTADELFKEKVVDKYSYIIQRTYDIQDRFILRITVADIKDYDEESDDK